MQESIKPKSIIFSAPSGSGKTTLVRHLMQTDLPLSFSISATTRRARSNEEDTKDYYFLSPAEFDQKIKNNEFLEWEEVYEGVKYGTLNSELKRIQRMAKVAVFDVDVLGGMSLKKKLGNDALALFIEVKDLHILKERLIKRASDSHESIQTRLEKAQYEMGFASKFDIIIINEDLDEAVKKTYNAISKFINE
jgi:guanylate kinase